MVKHATQEREAGDMPTDVQQVGMVSEGEAKPKNEQVEDKARTRRGQSLLLGFRV